MTEKQTPDPENTPGDAAAEEPRTAPTEAMPPQGMSAPAPDARPGGGAPSWERFVPAGAAAVALLALVLSITALVVADDGPENAAFHGGRDGSAAQQHEPGGGDHGGRHGGRDGYGGGPGGP